MYDSRLSGRSSGSTYTLPQKQQWALINQHRALEYERGRSMQKLLSQQKKDNFKRQLDHQLQQKHSMQRDQKAEDKRYYDYIVQKGQEMREKEEKEKFNRFILSKQMQEANKEKIEAYTDPKLEDIGKVYNIPIGIKSEEEKKQRAESIRRDVIQTLDKQRQEKSAEKMAEKYEDQKYMEKNIEYQNELDHRRLEKKYQQNPKVYNYYRGIYEQKMRKDKQLQHRFVDEAQQRLNQENNRRLQRERQALERRNMEMRDTLEQQLQQLNHKRQQENRVNPQQANYSFISNVFKDKRPHFDKQQYSKYLSRQAEEQRFNRLQQKYMSEQQYRYNSNQLSKAINGNYTFDRYHDRSMNTVGDRLNISNIDPVNNHDADVVKNKLEVARSYHPIKKLNQSSTDIAPAF